MLQRLNVILWNGLAIKYIENESIQTYSTIWLFYVSAKYGSAMINTYCTACWSIFLKTVLERHTI